MGAIFERLVKYNKANRSIDPLGSLRSGICGDNFSDLKQVTEELQNSLGWSLPTICRELSERMRFRALFALVPEECLYGNPQEDKPIIKQHLENLSIEPTSELVNIIKSICTNFRASKSSKYGITDVRVKFKHIYDRIMKDQNGRCLYCGVVLITGENATLDHHLPFRVGDDPVDGSNWVFCCNSCNTGKGTLPYYSVGQATINWPPLAKEVHPETRYAALARDKKCQYCGREPTNGELTIKKIVVSGCWVLDNIKVVCKDDCGT